MRWTERQRAMLCEMGVRLWEREPVLVAEAASREVEHGAANVVAPLPVAARPTASPSPSASASIRPGEQQTLLPAADWLIVGEPLDGGADRGDEAQLLDNMLRAIGLARDAATRAQRASYLALADRPAGVASSAENTTTIGADPDRRERLHRAIEIVRPACIVAFGRSAAQALLATDDPLGNLRGHRHEHAGVPVFVTCPLAFLLRHPDEKAKAWADLCLAVAAVDAIQLD